MKIKHFILLIIFPFLLFSCDEDDGNYTQVKANERLVYLAIKEYRENNSITDPFVLQFLMVEEAQIYSFKMASGIQTLGTEGLSDHWATIHEKIGGYNEQAMVLSTTSEQEDDILDELLQLPDAESVLLEDLTQCGVGIEKDTDGTSYITVLMMKVD